MDKYVLSVLFKVLMYLIQLIFLIVVVYEEFFEDLIYDFKHRKDKSI